MKKLTTYKNPSLADQISSCKSLQQLQEMLGTIYVFEQQGKIDLKNKTKRLIMKKFYEAKIRLTTIESQLPSVLPT